MHDFKRVTRMPRSSRQRFCAPLWVLASVFVAGCGVELAGVPTGRDDARALDALSDELTTTVASAGVEADLQCAALGLPRSADHREVFAALNAYRQANGLPLLIYSKTLERAADAMAVDMVARDFFAHIDPDGADPGDRALDAGFCHDYIGENLGSGFLATPGVMQAWKDSPGHDANMLRDDYMYVGIGVYRTATKGAIWIQEFALDPEAVALTTERALSR